MKIRFSDVWNMGKPKRQIRSPDEQCAAFSKCFDEEVMTKLFIKFFLFNGYTVHGAEGSAGVHEDWPVRRGSQENDRHQFHRSARCLQGLFPHPSRAR